MNEQTPPPPEEPTAQMPPAAEPAPAPTPAAAPSEPYTRNTLIAGGAVIAVVCGLIGYQLGDNSNSDLASERMAGPGRGFGNQQQMMPPGQGQGFQQRQDEDGDDHGQQDGQGQQGPPMSGAS